MKRGSSFLFTEWPMPPISGDVFGVTLRTPLTQFLRGVLICLDDVYVPGAATQVARNGVANFIIGRVGIRAEEGVSGHQHSGRAVAALQTVLLKESVLQGMQLAVLFETFDCSYITPVGLDGESGA